MTTPGKLFVPAQDGTVGQANAQLGTVNDSINAPTYGPAKDVSVHALHSGSQTIAEESQTIGVPPIAPGIVGGEQILQPPGTGPYTIYTFPSIGKVWAASVSLAVGVTGGTGVNLIYARVYISGGRTLAYCEVGVAGAVANGSNGDANTYPGFVVPSGTIILLDVNGGTSIAGGLIRSGGIFVGSVP